MIDTHAHLDFKDFDEDREETIQRFFSRSGKAIINVGVDLERSRKSIEIAEKHENVYASVGLHPDYFSQGSTFLSTSSADSSRPNLFLELKKIARHKNVVAIGETGLDYFHVTHNIKHETQEFEKIKESQRQGFLAQIKLARELSLPVIVHCREAWDDLYKIISKVRPFPPSHRRIPQGRTFFVLHCYSGEKKDTEKFLKLPSVFFSFSGNITFPKPAERSQKLAEAVRLVPLDKIMLDSDAPFLAPQEFRGKRNEPMYICHIAKKIAQIKEISVKEVEKVTDKNAKKFFGISLRITN